MSTAGVRGRLASLEAMNPPPHSSHGGGEAAGCEVEWADEHDDAEPEVCGKCGQQLVYVVTWGDEVGEGTS